ncbi:MAG: ABC transporter permease [Cyclobacteriaceae bacterium]|nr:ABC transporter permease [Cyclobacteriaceae bacterium]
MFKNYTRIAFRNFIKNKSFALLSVSSLVIAITSAILIGMYAKQEFSFDKLHERSSDIYRLVTVSENRGVRREVGFVPLPLSAHLSENFPAVENFARVWVYRRAMPVSVPDRDVDFYEDRFAWAEDSFFNIFDFEIVAGNRENPLGDFRSVVLSESTAKKYFDDEDPIGKTLHFRGETDIPVMVTAVMKDFPATSHFQFDFVANIKTAAEDFWQGGRATQEIFQRWQNLFVPAYIMVAPGTDLNPILAEATKQANEHLQVPGSVYTILAQPVTDIHLTSTLDAGEFEVNGSLANVYAVLAIGCIILALGCFNFVNMVTAQAGKRTKEVGLRKTIGGTRFQLMVQHYYECSLMVLAAVCISLLCAELLLPLLRNFILADNVISFFSGYPALLSLAGLTMLVILLSGAYPALFISAFSPGAVLKGTYSTHLGGSGLRKVLVTLQFALSGALIVCTMVVFQQLEFMKNKDLGFSEEQVVVIPIHRDNVIIPNFSRVKEAYLQHSAVRGVTASSHLMFTPYTYTDTFRFLGTEEDYRWEVYTVEGDYPEVYDMKLVAGRFFRYDSPADTNAIILNTKAVQEMGVQPEEVIGRMLEDRSLRMSGEVVGVVEDFHFKSLHNDIQPFALANRPDLVDFIFVKVNAEGMLSTLEFLEETWANIIPEASFGYYFLDSTFGAAYAREEKLGNSILGFSSVAIFLACLGLFGLSLFTAESRTKEIGVRKVLGASVWDIVRLLGLDFTKLVILSLILALPAAWLLMNYWLNDFAYRIDMPVGMIVVAAISILSVAWLTVSWHSMRAAMVNPVESLRTE